jgi:hypothetical protein
VKKSPEPKKASRKKVVQSDEESTGTKVRKAKIKVDLSIFEDLQWPTAMTSERCSCNFKKPDGPQNNLEPFATSQKTSARRSHHEGLNGGLRSQAKGG